jgi:hypothetical protein
MAGERGRHTRTTRRSSDDSGACDREPRDESGETRSAGRRAWCASSLHRAMGLARTRAAESSPRRLTTDRGGQGWIVAATGGSWRPRVGSRRLRVARAGSTDRATIPPDRESVGTRMPRRPARRGHISRESRRLAARLIGIPVPQDSRRGSSTTTTRRGASVGAAASLTVCCALNMRMAVMVRNSHGYLRIRTISALTEQGTLCHHGSPLVALPGTPVAHDGPRQPTE